MNLPPEKAAAYKKMTEEVFRGDALSKELFERLPYAAMVIHRDRIVLATNSLAKSIGVKEGTFCWDSFGKLASIPENHKCHFEETGEAPAGGTHCHFCHAEAALKKNEPVNVPVVLGDTTWDTYWVPLAEGIYLHYAVDITVKKN